MKRNVLSLCLLIMQRGMYVPVHNTVSWTNCLRTLILLVFISIERIGSGCYSF